MSSEIKQEAMRSELNLDGKEPNHMIQTCGCLDPDLCMSGCE